MIHLDSDLLHGIKWTQSKIKSLPLVDISNPIQYLLRSDSKVSSITSTLFINFIINHELYIITL